jgi:hypothetical protein
MMLVQAGGVTGGEVERIWPRTPEAIKFLRKGMTPFSISGSTIVNVAPSNPISRVLVTGRTSSIQIRIQKTDDLTNAQIVNVSTIDHQHFFHWEVATLEAFFDCDHELDDINRLAIQVTDQIRVWSNFTAESGIPVTGHLMENLDYLRKNLLSIENYD